MRWRRTCTALDEPTCCVMQHKPVTHGCICTMWGALHSNCHTVQRCLHARIEQERHSISDRGHKSLLPAQPSEPRTECRTAGNERPAHSRHTNLMAPYTRPARPVIMAPECSCQLSNGAHLWAGHWQRQTIRQPVTFRLQQLQAEHVCNVEQVVRVHACVPQHGLWQRAPPPVRRLQRLV